MFNARIFLISGIWVAVLPYLGFPIFWKNILFSATGIGLALFGSMIYREIKLKEKKDAAFDNFSENSNWTEGGEPKEEI